MATDKGTFSITVEPKEFRDLMSVLRSLDKETSAKLRDAALPLSKRFAGQLYQFAMAAPTPQAKLVAQSITEKRDRLPRVDIGGAKKVGRPYGGELRKNGKRVKQTAAPAGALLWGSEHGSHGGVDSIGRKYTNRFGASYSKSGYWITPAVEFYAPVVAREYESLLIQVIKESKLDGNS